VTKCRNSESLPFQISSTIIENRQSLRTPNTTLHGNVENRRCSIYGHFKQHFKL